MSDRLSVLLGIVGVAALVSTLLAGITTLSGPPAAVPDEAEPAPTGQTPAVSTPPEPAPERQRARFDVSLIYVLTIALVAILLGASIATLVQGAFSRTRGRSPPGLGREFRAHIVTFAWIVGSVSGSYTIARIAELLIDAIFSDQANVGFDNIPVL